MVCKPILVLLYAMHSSPLFSALVFNTY